MWPQKTASIVDVANLRIYEAFWALLGKLVAFPSRIVRSPVSILEVASSEIARFTAPTEPRLHPFHTQQLTQLSTCHGHCMPSADCTPSNLFFRMCAQSHLQCIRCVTFIGYGDHQGHEIINFLWNSSGESFTPACCPKPPQGTNYSAETD